MEPVKSIRNQYLGINAHLHSQWQAEGRWSGFHTLQIGDLLRLLKAKLRPLGYTADIEESLQIRRLGDTTGYLRADIAVYDLNPQRINQSSTRLRENTIPLPELLDAPED